MRRKRAHLADLVADPVFFADDGRTNLVASILLTLSILLILPHLLGWDSIAARIAFVMGLAELARIGCRKWTS